MGMREETRHLALEALTTVPPTSLFHEPIEYVVADHFRQRTLCRVLDDIAEAELPDDDLLAAALAFLQNDFGPHVLDEEEYLIPRMRMATRRGTDLSQVAHD